jgi:uncharacterized YccA/Bax inhibitor family protein
MTQQPGGGNPFGQQQAPYGQQPYGQQPMSAEQLQQQYNQQAAGPVQTGRMTMDDVVAKTAMMILLVVVAGGVSWAFLPMGVGLAAGLVAFGIAMFVIFKRQVNPALTASYAVVEGVFLGAISHSFNDRWPGIVVQAVLGTAMVFGGMLFAYKSGWVKVTGRYARIGIAIAIGFLGLTLINLVVMMIGGGDGLGLRSGPIGVLFGIVGILLGAFFLSLDFHEAEQLVAAGVPEKESWRVAFGLTLSLVWIYMEMLRLLSILRGD